MGKNLESSKIIKNIENIRRNFYELIWSLIPEDCSIGEYCSRFESLVLAQERFFSIALDLVRENIYYGKEIESSKKNIRNLYRDFLSLKKDYSDLIKNPGIKDSSEAIFSKKPGKKKVIH